MTLAFIASAVVPRSRLKNLRIDTSRRYARCVSISQRQASLTTASSQPITSLQTSVASVNESASTNRPNLLRAWARLVLASLGLLVLGSVTRPRVGGVFAPQPVIASEETTVQVRTSEPIPLQALGIKPSDFLSERELRARKTTQYSEAEEEIMELEEYEVSTKWFRDLRALWAGIVSVGGILVLYRGGVMWEKWIQEQEKKDMEEEIRLTGTFISPKAVRKEDDDDIARKFAVKSDGGDSGGRLGLWQRFVRFLARLRPGGRSAT